jgi:predicted dehydrogenase
MNAARPLSRRSFLTSAAKGVTVLSAAATVPQYLHAAAHERLRVGVIGLRTQGTIVAKSFIKTGEAEIAAVCDVDRQILDAQAAQIESAQGKKVEKHGDFRRILERPDIDAVIIATPDHWHAIIAIMACQASKDVYLEKPCAHNVLECHEVAKAAQRYGRVIQHGTMQRSGAHFKEAREYIRSGKLGHVAFVRCYSILGRTNIGRKPATDPPAHLDYDAWLGPAPFQPFHENRCHYNWRFMWNYGTGDMGNWGVHWLDMPLWMLELGWPDAVACSGGKYVHDDDKETPDTQTALYEYPKLTVAWELRMWSRFPNQEASPTAARCDVLR